MERIVAGFGRGNFLVPDLIRVIDFFYHDPLVQDGDPFADKQKGVRLFAGYDFVQPAAIFHLAGKIVLLPDFDNQFVGFMVLEADEIKLIRAGLAGMPDLVKIRVDAHGPAQHQRVKVQFVDPLLNENGPLQKVRAHINADLFPGILGNCQDRLADIVAAVGNQGELELAAVFLKPPVLIGSPAGFGQQPGSLAGIVRHRLNLMVVVFGLFDKRAGNAFGLIIEHML
jgi:hypothetical protein